jgi:dihydrofolate reductase
MIKLILAHDRDNAIGYLDGRLPWKCSLDMQRFKQLTTGSTVIMGRKTFESLGRPAGLPNRTNYVVTSHILDYQSTVYSYPTVEDAIIAAKQDAWIIGGAQIYNYSIEHQLVDEIHGTLIDARTAADVKLTHNLSDLHEFVALQAEHGVKWNLQTEIPTSPQPDDQAHVALFYTLKKER